MEKRRFLIAHPIPGGSGTQVLYMWARSQEEITDRLPDAEIWDGAPEWMTEEMKERVRSREYDVDEPLDILTLARTPNVVFDRNDPPPEFEIVRDDPDALERGPEALSKVRRLFRERT